MSRALRNLRVRNMKGELMKIKSWERPPFNQRMLRIGRRNRNIDDFSVLKLLSHSIMFQDPFGCWLEKHNLNLHIFLLIEKGEHKAVKSLLIKELCPNNEPNVENLLLHYSVFWCDDILLIKYLLDQGWNVNAQEDSGYTPLMVAITTNKTRVLPILLKAGADIDIVNNAGKSALHLAIEKHNDECTLRPMFHALRKKCMNSEEMAKILMNAGCTLYQATFTKDSKIIEYMIENGKYVESMHPDTRQTALYSSVLLGDLESVRVFLKYSADIHAVYYIRGLSPLTYVCKNLKCGDFNQKYDILKALVNECAPELYKKDISTIKIALAQGHNEAILVLLQSNLSRMNRDKLNGKTLLHYLAQNTFLQLTDQIKDLIRNYNVNALDNNGVSPLYDAVEVKNVNMVDYLLKHGANPHYKHNLNQSTALTLVHNYPRMDDRNIEKSVRIAELLFQYDANPQVLFQRSSIGYNPTTIFDATLHCYNFERMKTAIAHTAMIQLLGAKILGCIRLNIYSDDSFNQYFKKCQIQLKKRIFGKVTVLQLLTANPKELTSYLKNKQLLRKLLRVSYVQELQLTYPYYYNRMKDRIIKITQDKMIKNTATWVICQIFENRVDVHNLIVHRIMDYLTDYDLTKLCKSQDK